jgi:hypothetical protein
MHSIRPKIHVLECFGPFRYCTKVNANKVASEFFATDAPDPFHWTQNSCFGRFGPFRYCMKVDAKLAKLVPLSHKFAKQGRVDNFRYERTRSTELRPKLKFWGVSDRFVTQRKSMQNWPNWCHYRTSSLNKVTSEFFAMNAPDPLHWNQNSCFGAFRTVLLLHKSRWKTGRTGAIIAQVQ